MKPSSTVGLSLAGIYALTCIALIWSQGLFGESFIAIILGLPWTLALSYFEFGNVSGALIYVLILTPMLLNALVLYWIGSLIDRRK